MAEAERSARSITAAEIFDLTRILSSPHMEGRLAGSPGYDRAARWSVEKFKAWGLKPLYPGYLQPIEVGYNETGDSAFSLILPPSTLISLPSLNSIL